MSYKTTSPDDLFFQTMTTQRPTGCPLPGASTRLQPPVNHNHNVNNTSTVREPPANTYRGSTSTKIAGSTDNTPTFVFKRHTALALVKDIAQLHRNILTELGRLGLSDYSFGVVSSSQVLHTPLTTAPKELVELYENEGFYKDDQVVGYLLANSRPAFRTTIERYIESAPVETNLTQRNRELIGIWRNFGFLESYLIPVDGDGSTLTVGTKHEAPTVVQQKVEKCTEELCALGKVIRHVCLRKFPEALSTDKPESAPLSINKRPLEVLAALANGCPTVYAVAAELGISLNTTNHHIATAKAALGATSLPHAIAIAIRRGLV